VVTLGQVKNIVTQAVSYFDGLGYDTSELLLSDNVSLPDAIAGWDRDPEVNALVATVGQVKNHAEPFWRYLITNELLSSEGQLYTEADIPWTLNDASDDNNLAVATIGQVKNAFAFALALGEHNFDNGILDELEEVNNATQLTGEERFLPLEPFVTHAPEALGAEVLPGSSSLNLVIPEFAPTPPSTVSLEEEEGIEFALEKEGANVLNTFPNVASVNATLYSDGSLKHEFAYDGDEIEVHEIDDLRYIELNGTDSGVGFYREFTLAPGDILEGGITSVGREDIEPDTFYNKRRF